MTRPALLALPLAALLLARPAAAARPSEPALEGLYPELEALYLELHQSPELSWHEEKTAARLAARLKGLGFTVTEHLGGTGVVGVLENGKGPAVLVRTELDALPVEERTGLSYASKATTVDDAGEKVPVMHACGHDLHMTAWVGAATLLARSRDRWHGKLIFVGQPAEERGGGAAAMLKDGLYQKFGKPDFAIALHDSADLPAGSVGWVSGPALANVDSVDVHFYGRGGHGAYPHKTVDPIVIAARFVTALQTVVARENNPLDPAVITVGSFHAGTKHNIIPDEAHLQLTVRSYKDDVRKRLIAAIGRLARAEAAAAAAPREPEVKTSEGTPATYNDPQLTARLVKVLTDQLGAERLIETPPVMGGEDFSEFGRAGVPAVLFWVGGVEPGAWAESRSGSRQLPSLHSSLWAPDKGPAIRTGVTTLVAAIDELMGNR
jgi:hippurate hydrolase